MCYRNHAPGSTHMVAIEGPYYYRIEMPTVAPDFLIGRAAVDCGQHLTYTSHASELSAIRELFCMGDRAKEHVNELLICRHAMLPL